MLLLLKLMLPDGLKIFSEITYVMEMLIQFKLYMNNQEWGEQYRVMPAS